MALAVQDGACIGNGTFQVIIQACCYYFPMNLSNLRTSLQRFQEAFSVATYSAYSGLC